MDTISFLSLVAALITILGTGGLPVVLTQKYKDKVLTKCGDGPILYLRYAIFAGANINSLDEHGWSALHWASFDGNLKAVHLLVKAGADVNLVNSENKTPLMFSLSKEIWSKEKPKIISYLLENGAEVNFGEYWNAMTYAKRDSPEFIDLLIEYGAKA